VDAPRWTESTLRIPAMDCPTEEQLVRMALAGLGGVATLEFDLPARRLVVVHSGPVAPVLAAVERAGLGADVEGSRSVAAPEVPQEAGRAAAEVRVLVIVLAINLVMFVIELAAGLWARSTGLVADSLDMLADASVYAIALAGAGASVHGQRRAARASGWLQLGLAGMVLAEVVRRAIEGGEPRSDVMMAIGVLALLANVTCMVVLAGHRSGGAHMRASWIFTTNDVLANLGVILAGQLVAVTGSAWPDLLVGTAIALLVGSGGLRILGMTRQP
jgi:Co/Zn/Cd efflux system component